jgi:hypothetical protein
MRHLKTTPREFVEGIIIAAILTTPVWLGMLFDRF